VPTNLAQKPTLTPDTSLLSVARDTALLVRNSVDAVWEALEDSALTQRNAELTRIATTVGQVDYQDEARQAVVDYGTAVNKVEVEMALVVRYLRRLNNLLSTLPEYRNMFTISYSGSIDCGRGG
jgi:hypothetical protein